MRVELGGVREREMGDQLRHRQLTEAAVTIVHHQISTQRTSSEIIHTASSIGDISHDNCVSSRETVGEQAETTA